MQPTDFIYHSIWSPHLQNIIIQSAALSRYFWPPRNRVKELNKIHKKRAEYLREAFEISKNSALKNRDLRNQLFSTI